MNDSQKVGAVAGFALAICLCIIASISLSFNVIEAIVFGAACCV